MRNISRRTLLAGIAAGAGSGLLVGGRALADPPKMPRPMLFPSPQLAPFVDDLPVLPHVGGSSLTIDAVDAMHSFHRDLAPGPALAYGGNTYLGPVITAHRGQETTIEYRNRITAHPFAADFDTTLHGLSERDRTDVATSMHLHGGVTPPEFDGHPEKVVRPGQGSTYRFPNRQAAAALWYHDHAMAVTRLNVYAGLAGLYLLRDEYDTGERGNPLGLPAGEFELPLVLQEKIVNGDGTQSIRSTPIVPQGRWEGGAVGDVGVVNGKIWPEKSVARGLYRLRLVNAASFSVWDLHFSNGMPFWVIGMEGGLLDAPAPTTRVRLAPGERADLLVDFGTLEPGATVELRNIEPAAPQAAQIGAVHMPMFMRFRAEATRGFRGPVPVRLRGGPGQAPVVGPVPVPQHVRHVSLSQPSDVRLPPSIMSLNNLRFHSEDIEMPRQGTVEQWNIVNATPDPHPIHLHLVHFRVVGRQAIDTLAMCARQPQPPIGTKWTPDADPFVVEPLRGPEPWETGYKDTVICDPNSVTRIVAYFPTADELGFDPDATFSAAVGASGTQGAHHDSHAGHGEAHRLQGYVWHCHVLDHEDHDMMLKYRTVQ
ncbi:multicopper oxidase family protein [Rhodococcus coprophilus]|uniref:Phenoxazinone synthase n=1 Tax=Rhodococcus coprophilus TaxID=38310 RepID=A0A2X4X5P7_9NOCA|nr:multicopper oxidase domain-containing protein [Rhodococcus coprophilus]MBM7458279.1 FtsP/CotA-like multicopper oxidase with cupredoxin domain [Rhodococcus coprophilus]SQI31824.1 phenoxazinone synthase [Rhodococcus coprophilus]